MYTGYITAKTDEAGVPADRRVLVYALDIDEAARAPALTACWREAARVVPSIYYVLQVRVEPSR